MGVQLNWWQAVVSESPTPFSGRQSMPRNSCGGMSQVRVRVRWPLPHVTLHWDQSDVDWNKQLDDGGGAGWDRRDRRGRNDDDGDDDDDDDGSRHWDHSDHSVQMPGIKNTTLHSLTSFVDFTLRRSFYNWQSSINSQLCSCVYC